MSTRVGEAMIGEVLPVRGTSIDGWCSTSRLNSDPHKGV